MCAVVGQLVQLGVGTVRGEGFMDGPGTAGDGDVLGNRRQMQASLRLSRWLRCKFHIRLRNVIGHNESLRSPYHRERVRRLRHQTHGDFRHSSMRVYRKRLSRLERC